ncbi:hypothetical protein [Candidatus Villigracilis saccharophilus]|uniref:hypothetical protein n=1 Tax=Candidatus Villigracilis saccharophilus TaxID=3140684 RepID=UPI00313510B4|nr:hypothetical protein [Anaerolineales bacterium]
MKLSFPVRIFLIALVLRLIPVLLTRSLGIGLDDMFQYDMLARSLASGRGFRWYAQADLKQLEPYVDFDLATAKGYDPKYGLYTSFRAPLYPAFLAIVYYFSGAGASRFFAARLAQIIFLGAPLAPLTYLVSKRLAASSFLMKQNWKGRQKHPRGWLPVIPCFLFIHWDLAQKILSLFCFLFPTFFFLNPSNSRRNLIFFFPLFF